ncbi:unnamed protein product, partial [Allacma fusca]
MIKNNVQNGTITNISAVADQ